MKQKNVVAELSEGESLPTRERGLKLRYHFAEIKPPLVAPHAGAWIETPLTVCTSVKCLVAPHAGAWIETQEVQIGAIDVKSLPTRERGLKRIDLCTALFIDGSLPTRERGLKL